MFQTTNQLWLLAFLTGNWKISGLEFWLPHSGSFKKSPSIMTGLWRPVFIVVATSVGVPKQKYVCYPLAMVFQFFINPIKSPPSLSHSDYISDYKIDATGMGGRKWDPVGCWSHWIQSQDTTSMPKIKVVIHSHTTSKSSGSKVDLKVNWYGSTVASIRTKNITCDGTIFSPNQRGSNGYGY